MPSAFLLDITRLASRLERGALTGIDRVEAAYLTYILAQDAPIFGLLRSNFGFLLLGRAGLVRLADMLAAKPLLPPRAWAIDARGVALLRPFAIARQPHFRLLALLRWVPQGAVYLNVGHSNLTAAVLAAMGRAGITRAVMIHDTIPLDYPQFARAGTHARFAAKIAAVAQHADLALHISQDARSKSEAHFAAQGRVPLGVTAPLGITLAAPLPSPLIPARPYFVALGTIEPRKNLGLLLDIWQQMGTGAQVPQLVVIGAKGWAEPALFDKMAQLQAAGVLLHGENLPDGAVASLLRGAIALLFPTFAEGFGLPPLEALGHGTAVIASDLPVLRETCGEMAVYLDPMDSYSWMETIKTLASQGDAGQERRRADVLPSWSDHFTKVLTQIG